MNNRKCEECIYGDICNGPEACDFYTPFGDAEEVMLEEEINKEAEAFYKDWFEYISYAQF